MKIFLKSLAKLINYVAILGCGLPSAGFSYNPPKPKQDFQSSRGHTTNKTF